ncbi:MAG: 50S rRNA methyltransferase [Chlamydiia bacterium]|nr:50S rRNA methyltransferase [Chlamydiia bacterium]
MVKLFVTCGSGLEPLLIEELTSFGFSNLKPGFRGVYVEAPDFSAVYKINYLSRIATRVLLPIANFKVWDKKTLYKGAAKVDWSQYLDVKKTFSIDFSVSHKAFKNTLFAAQVVKDALCDHFREKTGVRPNVKTSNPQVQFHLFIYNDWATISLDTSGAPLHKRGYRMEGGEAPLQENLAAALLTMAGYHKDEVLLDPCMGSGTFLVEAAMIATNTPPGYLREHWGFFSHPDFNQETWEAFKAQEDEKILPLAPKKLFGIDKNKAQVQKAMANTRLAGLHKGVAISEGDFRDFKPPVKPTMLIANPPYGKRLDEGDYLDRLYNELGDFYKAQAPAKGFILMPPDRSIGLKPTKRNVVFNGGIESRFNEYDLWDKED